MTIPMMFERAGYEYRTLAARELEPRGGQERWQVTAIMLGNAEDLNGEGADIYRTTFTEAHGFGGMRWEAPERFLFDLDYWRMLRRHGWTLVDPVIRRISTEFGGPDNE